MLSKIIGFLLKPLNLFKSPEFLITLKLFLSKKKNIFISVLTFISILGVLIAVVSLITVNSVVKGFELEIKEKIIENEPHIMIHSKNKNTKDEKYNNIISKLSNIKEISSITNYLDSTVLISSSSNLNAVKLRGIDTVRAKKTYGIFRKLKTGKLSYVDNPKLAYIDLMKRLDRAYIKERQSYLKTIPLRDKAEIESVKEEIKTLKTRKHKAKNYPCVFIGSALAEALHLRTGEDLKLITPFGDIGPSGLMPKSRKFRICGTFFTTLYEFDMSHVYMRIGEAKKFLGIDNVTGIEIKLNNIKTSPSVLKKIEKLVSKKDYNISGFSKMNKNLLDALNLERKATYLILFLIVLVSSFNIVATLTLIVNSKKKEIAILKSLGFTNNRIRKIFIYKGILIGSIGISFGTILGLIAAKILSLYRMNAEVYYIQNLPVRLTFLDVSVIVFISFMVALLSSVIPASRAANILPVYGLKDK